MLYEDEWGIVDDGGGVGLVDGPATAFVCTLFMAAIGQLSVVCSRLSKVVRHNHHRRHA